MPQVLIHTLGCKLNQLESESFNEQLANSNEQIVLINTCTVTSKAEQKCRRVIRKALKENPNAKIIVTGCYAELESETIKNISRSDVAAQRLLVLKREEILNYLNNNSCRTEGTHSSKFDTNFQFFPDKFTNHTRSFLKIQDGCDNHCTYCRIRLARGKSVSLPAEQVLGRLKILENNYAEAVITGVNITQYSSVFSVTQCPPCGNLFDLLEYLLANTDKIAIRLSSLDPQYIDEKFAKVLTHKRIRPHFHLSIQSCSEKVLKRMGRSYNAEIIEKAVNLLRTVKGDPFLACDIITGFPGETEAEFNETYELCKKIGFAWIHVFPYSKRPGTAAAAYKDNVNNSEVTRRVKLLTDLAVLGRREYVERWIGKEAEVIVEKGGRGVTENYLKVRIDDIKLATGTVFRCLLKADMVENYKKID